MLGARIASYPGSWALSCPQRAWVQGQGMYWKCSADWYTECETGQMYCKCECSVDWRSRSTVITIKYCLCQTHGSPTLIWHSDRACNKVCSCRSNLNVNIAFKTVTLWVGSWACMCIFIYKTWCYKLTKKKVEWLPITDRSNWKWRPRPYQLEIPVNPHSETHLETTTYNSLRLIAFQLISMSHIAPLYTVALIVWITKCCSQLPRNGQKRLLTCKTSCNFCSYEWKQWWWSCANVGVSASWIDSISAIPFAWHRQR